MSGPKLVQAHAYLNQTRDLLVFFADRLKVQLREQARGTIWSMRCSR